MLSMFQDMELPPSPLLVGVTGFLSMAGSLAFYAWLRRSTGGGSRAFKACSGTVSRILVYPVKSARAVSLEQCKCLKRGFEYDRRWVVVNTESTRKPAGTDGVDVSMVNHPRMAQIQPKIGHAGGGSAADDESRTTMTLTLSAGGMADVSVTEEQMRSGHEATVHVLRVACRAVDCGDAVASWLSEFLCVPGLRLYHMAESGEGRLSQRDPKWGSLAGPDDVVSFASFAPYLLCTEQSLRDVNDVIGCDAEMERFRPNIVVDCPTVTPYAEDEWLRFDVGGIAFHTMKKCGRCPITQQDPATGEVNLPTLLPKLREYRLDTGDARQGNAPIFGIQVAAGGEGLISVGDRISVPDHE